MEYINEIKHRKQIDLLSIKDLKKIDEIDKEDRIYKDFEYISELIKNSVENDEMDVEKIYYIKLYNKKIILFYYDDKSKILFPYFYKKGAFSRPKAVSNPYNLAIAKACMENVEKNIYLYKNLPFKMQNEMFINLFDDIKMKNYDTAKKMLYTYLPILFKYPYFNNKLLPVEFIKDIKSFLENDIQSTLKEEMKGINKIYSVLLSDKEKSFAFSDKKQAIKYIFNMYNEDIPTIVETDLSSIVAYLKTEEGYIYLIE